MKDCLEMFLRLCLMCLVWFVLTAITIGVPAIAIVWIIKTLTN